MIVIDYQDRRPIYEQIVEKFQILILKGIMDANEQMPSVRKLAVELSINPNTIQKAYSMLEQQGYIYPVKGRGNFVSDKGALLKEKQKLFSPVKAQRKIWWKRMNRIPFIQRMQRVIKSPILHHRNIPKCLVSWWWQREVIIP